MSRHDYQEVEVFRDPDGVVAVITKRGDTDYLSFALQKEFTRRTPAGHVGEGEDKTVRTSFLNRRHIPAVRRLLAQLEEYLDREADRATAARTASPRKPSG